ncbi:26.7 kDa heat shock protein, chloroplastic-like [Ananas comosus]|uniref:26.7 kDa heat shock protein, chloroplastic n=1 Tax=Ananas comosus TaxID=4615 RepID=A0A199VQ75_ANACO|nr:26.7 kDa heat shock protein, chloroplastic-like [Ananas comosus]OAY79342.1 26.7 kDa heat shock protein, chloroplastic [Ananas comosus]
MLEAMDLVYEDVPAPPEMRRSRSLSMAGNLWAPWDIMEDEKEVRMRFDMPGLSKEEVKVTVEDDMLLIRGEHKKDDQKGPGGGGPEKTPEKGTWWKERSFSSYDMHILLPDYCDKKKVTAELKHGVLLITIPKISDKKEIVSVDVKG